MFQASFKQLAVLLFASASCCFLTVPRAGGSEWLPASPDAACESEYDGSRPTCGESFCRKLRLQGSYTKRAFRPRYVLLPSRQPRSIINYQPAMTGPGGYGPAVNPGAGAMSGYSSSYGYGVPGYATSPAYAPPGSVFIR